MGDNAYYLRARSHVVSHGSHGSQTAFVRDDDTPFNKLDVEALIASGDCFITIATSLDDCTKLMEASDSNALPQIENAISLLLYLQRHYQIVRKLPESRP